MFDSLKVLSLSLAVAQEVAKLAGMDVLMDLNEEPLTELESLRKLFSQLPYALQELREYGRHLFWFGVQLIAPVGKWKACYFSLFKQLESRTKLRIMLTCLQTYVQRKSSLFQ